MKHSRHSLVVKSRILKSSELPEVYEKLRRHFGDQKWWPGETAFEIIVGAILTQNTSWTNVGKAIQNLRQAGKLEPTKLNKISAQELAALIRPAGYFNIKAKRLKNFMNFLFQKYAGNLDKMFAQEPSQLREQLLNVNGIGPETADSILLYAGLKPFFVIDAYTKRIFSRHRIDFFRRGLSAFRAEYEAWRQNFESSIQRDVSLYNDFHAQLVALGKNYCKASKPLCFECPLRHFL